MCVFDAAVHYADYLLPGEPRHVLDVGRMTRAGFGRLCDVLRSEQPAILHTWRDTANFWGRMATARVPVPIVVASTRNRALNPLNVLTERRFARRTARVLANSEGVRRELVSLARVPADKIQIIHNFIDLDRFRPPTAEERRPGARAAGTSRRATSRCWSRDASAGRSTSSAWRWRSGDPAPGSCRRTCVCCSPDGATIGSTARCWIRG